MAALNLAGVQPAGTFEGDSALSPRMLQQLREVDQKPLSTHFYSEEEKAGLVEFLNNELGTSINTRSDDIFEEVKKGLVLKCVVSVVSAKAPAAWSEPLLEISPADSAPTTSFYQLLAKIQPNALPRAPALSNNPFEILENHKMLLDGARKIGATIVNVGPEDLRDGTAHLVLGVFWQLVRFGLLKRVSALSGDTLGLPPEQILLQWANIHLRNAGYNKAIMNFGSDLKDGEALIRLLNQIAPNECSLDILNIADPYERARRILQVAEKLGCRKFITEDDIVKGNGRLNVAFLATLFTAFPDMGEKSRVRALEAEVQTLKSDLETSRQQISMMRGDKLVMQTEIDSLRQQAELMQAEQSAASSEFAQATEKVIRDTRKTVEDMQQQHQAEIRRIMEDNHAKHAQEMADLQKKHEASLEVMRTSFQNELAREKAESGKAIAELQRLLAEAIEREKRIKLSIVSEDIQGFLYKKGKKGNKMQRRLFVLRGEYIMYYKDSHDMSKPAGSIYIITLNKVSMLDDVTTAKYAGTKTLKYGFEMHSAEQNRVYFVVAETEEDRKMWMNAIKNNQRRYATRKSLQELLAGDPIPQQPGATGAIPPSPRSSAVPPSPRSTGPTTPQNP